jgi:hypothetical protein
MSRRLAIWAVLVISGAPGCSERESASRPRGLTASEAPPLPPANTPAPVTAPAAPPPPRSLPSPFAASRPDPGALTNPLPERAKPPEEAGAAVEQPKRDLAVELAQLVGQPLSCVDFSAIVAGGGKLAITVSAQVVPSGRITRAEVTAPGQPAKALRCIEQLVTSGSFQSPVPDAPRKVTTNVTMQVVANPR